MDTTNPPAGRNLPTIAELFSDNLQEAFKNEQLNLLLNTEPKKEWIKEHPYIKNYRYIPIDKIEFLLRKLFKKYRIEITAQGTAFNGVWVTVRVHYYNMASDEWSYHDGIGACQLQTKSGTSPADLININNGAIAMAFPIAKTVAIKDACDHFGKLFGCDLNRKDTIPFSFDKNLEKEKFTEEVAMEIQRIGDLGGLEKYYADNTQLYTNLEFKGAINQRRADLVKAQKNG